MQKNATSLSSILRMLFVIVGYPVALAAMLLHTFIHGGRELTEHQKQEQLSNRLRKLLRELEK